MLQKSGLSQSETIYCEQIKIQNDSRGYSYTNIFGKCFDDNVTRIIVEDPYIREGYQIENFVRFCELCIRNKKCCLMKIHLITNYDSKKEKKFQEKKFEVLKKILLQNDVELTWTWDLHLHDREIRFDNGWIVKIGRGLDIYKKSKEEGDPEDLDLRKCKKTTVDIFVIPKSSPLNNNELCVTVKESSSQTETVKSKPPNNTETTRTVKESSTQTDNEKSKPLNNKEKSPKVQNQDTQTVKKQLGYSQINQDCFKKSSHKSCKRKDKISSKHSSKKSFVSRLLSIFRN